LNFQTFEEKLFLTSSLCIDLLGCGEIRKVTMTADNETESKTSFRNIFALGFVSFFTDVSTEMVLSLLPVFIVSLPGSGSAALGIIEGLAESLSYGMRVVSGIFSDKLRRRKVIILLGYGVSNIVKPFFAVVNNVLEAMAIRVADRIGKGIRTAPRDALLSESVDENRRDMAFGLHRTLDQTGAILGPLAVSFLLYVTGLTIRGVFWLSLIPGVAALITLAFFVQERVAARRRGFKILAGIQEALKGDFLILLLIVAIFSLGAFNYSFVLLNASEAGFYALIILSHTIIAIPSGVLSDRIGKERVLVMGYEAFLTAALSLFLFPRNYYAAFLIALIFGVYDGIANTVARALIPRYAENALRGTAYGLYYLTVGLCFLISNVTVGALWQSYSPSVAAAYSITLSSISIIGMIQFINKRRARQSGDK